MLLYLTQQYGCADPSTNYISGNVETNALLDTVITSMLSFMI